jgi:hypothetical protein
MTKRPYLSKTRYISGLQCHLKLWYDCYQRELAAEVSPSQQAIFDTGHEVGRVATWRHPGGVFVDRDALGAAGALDRTREVLGDKKVPAIFEAALRHANTQVHVDILARAPHGRWDLIEVKSSTKVKPPNEDDVAVQHWVLRGVGIDVRKAGILTLNNEYVYEGGDYDVDELFAFNDLTDVALEKHDEVAERIAELQAVVDAKKPPKIAPGEHCFKPYDCLYYAHCTRGMAVESPATTTREVVGPGLAAALKGLEYPIHHLDFETFMPALPRYRGTRPYQTLPFQWSNHTQQRGGALRHDEFLCREDVDPRPAFAESLLTSLGEKGTICVYTSYERTVIRALADALPRFARRLRALEDRMWDLYAVIRAHYNHPKFAGSFSLKSVLPVLVPKMSYDAMPVADGNAAQRAYLESITTDDAARRAELHDALLAYCGQDSLAMVEVRRVLGEKVGR